MVVVDVDVLISKRQKKFHLQSNSLAVNHPFHIVLLDLSLLVWQLLLPRALNNSSHCE